LATSQQSPLATLPKSTLVALQQSPLATLPESTLASLQQAMFAASQQTALATSQQATLATFQQTALASSSQQATLATSQQAPLASSQQATLATSRQAPLTAHRPTSATIIRMPSGLLRSLYPAQVGQQHQVIAVRRPPVPVTEIRPSVTITKRPVLVTSSSSQPRLPASHSIFAPSSQPVYAPSSQPVYAPSSQSALAPTSQAVFASSSQPVFVPSLQPAVPTVVGASQQKFLMYQPPLARGGPLPHFQVLQPAPPTPRAVVVPVGPRPLLAPPSTTIVALRPPLSAVSTSFPAPRIQLSGVQARGGNLQGFHLERSASDSTGASQPAVQIVKRPHGLAFATARGAAVVGGASAAKIVRQAGPVSLAAANQAQPGPNCMSSSSATQLFQVQQQLSQPIFMSSTSSQPQQFRPILMSSAAQQQQPQQQQPRPILMSSLSPAQRPRPILMSSAEQPQQTRPQPVQPLPRPTLMSSALVVPRVVPVVSTPVVVLGAGHQRALVGFQPRCAPPSAAAVAAPSLVQVQAAAGSGLRPALMMGGGGNRFPVAPPGVKIIRPAAGARWRNNGGGGLRPLRPALCSSDPTGDFLARVSSRHTTAAAAQSSQKLPLPPISSTSVSLKTVPEGTASATASQQAVVAALQQAAAATQQATAVTQQPVAVTQQAATASRQAVVAALQQYAVASQQPVAVSQQAAAVDQQAVAVSQQAAAVTQQAVDVTHPTTATLAAAPPTQGLAESQAAAVSATSLSVAVRAADTRQTAAVSAAPQKTAAAPSRKTAGASNKRPDKRTLARAWPYRIPRGGTAGYYRPTTSSGIDTSKPWRFETEVKAGRPFNIFQSLRT
jgi:hypothetical protein